MKKPLAFAGLLMLLALPQAFGRPAGSGRVNIAITPASARVQPGATVKFTATVTGSSNTAVTWSATGGTLSGTGGTVTYTAPASPGSYTVTATSVADADQSASADVTVAPPAKESICQSPEQVVDILDPSLKAALQKTLGTSGKPTCTAMQKLTKLTLNGKSILSLAGLEYVSNLTTLYLSNNQIIDISPLAKLTHLELLVLSGNQIRDIGPLAHLTKLTFVVLDNNRVSSIQPLADNRGLGRGDDVFISDNCLNLSSAQVMKEIARLETRDVLVAYRPQDGCR